jgi:hypothetical protein
MLEINAIIYSMDRKVEILTQVNLTNSTTQPLKFDPACSNIDNFTAPAKITANNLNKNENLAAVIMHGEVRLSRSIIHNCE